jgi:hypothetical protein
MNQLNALSNRVEYYGLPLRQPTSFIGLEGTLCKLRRRHLRRYDSNILVAHCLQARDRPILLRRNLEKQLSVLTLE